MNKLSPYVRFSISHHNASSCYEITCWQRKQNTFICFFLFIYSFLSESNTMSRRSYFFKQINELSLLGLRGTGFLEVKISQKRADALFSFWEKVLSPLSLQDLHRIFIMKFHRLMQNKRLQSWWIGNIVSYCGFIKVFFFFSFICEFLTYKITITLHSASSHVS